MEIPVLNEIMRDTVVEVDLDRIAFNVRQIKAMAGPGTQVAAVVKADGYGHGALGIAPAIMENGASLLAVATLSAVSYTHLDVYKRQKFRRPLPLTPLAWKKGRFSA